MRVKTQMATPPTAAMSAMSSATAPPLTPLLEFLINSDVDVVVASSLVVVVRPTPRDAPVVVVATDVVAVVDALVARVVVVAALVVGVVARVVVGALVVVGSSCLTTAVVDACSLPTSPPVWARAASTPEVNAAIAPIVARRRSARRT